MDKQFFRELEHAKDEPLKIARWWEHGSEKIIIEGVTYDADYFRTFSHPETDVLYAVVKDAEGVVCLTVIDSLEKATEFFEAVADGGCPSTALRSAQDEEEENDDGI
jgi:hypothetical protein